MANKMFFQKLKYLINKEQYGRAGQLLKLKGINMLRFCHVYLDKDTDFLEFPLPLLIRSEKVNEHFWLFHNKQEDINGIPVFTFSEFKEIAKEYVNGHFKNTGEFSY